MKKLMLLTFYAGLSLSCSKSDKAVSSEYEPPVADTSTQKVITVMSYNVRSCIPYVPAGNTTPDVSATADVIRSISPDVVLIQELDIKTTRSYNTDQLAALAGYTGMQYTYFSKASTYQGGDFGIAILSKHKIEFSKTHLLPKLEVPGRYVEQRALCETRITFPGGHTYTVATTHLDLTVENRLAQVPVIDSILSRSSYPVIFGGDLNAVPGSETIDLLDAAAFENTCKTNCFTIPSTGPDRQLDYITIRPAGKFKVVSHQVIGGVTASDHLPVVTVLEMK
ncbi:endonuclease/exonuclease/phosphatase family protein [Chitinophaga sp. XS-30]|uniref:endonuclease/exonuclease/phosphatase family protein n=1 Tax=Chitinophaga sp. XS-30 TaxID=2604421 RepID=UPI00143DA1E9|nr:endonuclease/exonuclease/phosphatase family protein [Chitinophaga sp. XS-30]